MSSAIHAALLRLPSGIRRDVFLHITKSMKLTHLHNIRSFRTASRTLARPQASAKASQSKASHAAPLPPPPRVKLYKAPSPRTVPRTTDGQSTYIESLLGNGPVALYASPKHGTFYTVAYLCGGLFIVGDVCWASYALKEREGQPKAVWLQSLLIFEVVAVSIAGTAILLAPTKLIRSISLIPPKVAGSGSSITRFEIKRNLPFLKPDILEAGALDVSTVRKLPSTTADIKITSVPPSLAGQFTEEVLSGRAWKTEPRTTAQTIRAAALSVTHTWSMLKREVRRMFLKDQLLDITIGKNGSFKLDLQGCAMLDGGRPLNHLIQVKEDSGAFRWLRSIWRDR